MPRLIIPGFAFPGGGGATVPGGGGGTTTQPGDPPADGTVPTIGNVMFAIDCVNSPSTAQPGVSTTSNAGAAPLFGGYSIPYLVDTSGKGHHFLGNGASSNQPHTNTAYYKGMAPIHFDSSANQSFSAMNNTWQDAMRTGNPVMFIVCSGVAFNIGNFCIPISCGDRNGNGFEVQISGSGASYSPYVGWRVPGFTGVGDPTLDAYHNIAHIVVWRDNVAGTINIMSQNDTAPFSAAAPTAGGISWTEFNIAARNTGAGNTALTNYMGGVLYEARAWAPTTPIDVAYAKALLAYAAAKY